MWGVFQALLSSSLSKWPIQKYSYKSCDILGLWMDFYHSVISAFESTCVSSQCCVRDRGIINCLLRCYLGPGTGVLVPHAILKTLQVLLCLIKHSCTELSRQFEVILCIYGKVYLKTLLALLCNYVFWCSVCRWFTN